MSFSSAGSNDLLDWLENINVAGLGMGGFKDKDYGILGKKNTHGGFYKQGSHNFKVIEKMAEGHDKILVAG